MNLLYQLHPYLWYGAGSICFLVGTCVVIYRMVRG
jgi:hypothetical protein